MRRAYVDHDRKLIVCWAPKCACTSVVNWFMHGLLGLDNQEWRVDKIRGKRPWLVKKGYRLGPAEVISCIDQGYYSVAFTLDPFERAVSAYINQFVVSRSNHRVDFKDLHGISQRLYLKIKNVSENEARQTYEGITFNEYLTSVATAILRRGHRDAKLDIHWNTQVPFNWTEHHLKSVRRWDIKEFDQGILELNHHFGCTYMPEKSNITVFDSTYEPAAPDLSSRQLASLDKPPSRESFDNETTRELVKIAYGFDYEMLGYS